MRLLLIVYILAIGYCCIEAEPEAEEKKSDITKLDVVELAAESDDVKDSEVQRKRDSGYSYNRPDRFTTTGRFQIGQGGSKGRIVNRHPAQLSRPVMKYGPPNYQTSPAPKPGFLNQHHRDKLQHHHGHINQQHSNNFDKRPVGLFEQEVPKPIRHFEFTEPNPIASQNDEPFGTNTANYLPPQNQKLPAYSAPLFSSQQNLQNSHAQSGNLQSQNIVQSQEQQISDAALFLTQNAHAIQQLYGAAAADQDFAPQNDEFHGHTNQVQSPNAQFQNFKSNSQTSQHFPGALPSYASGTLSSQETLEQIQSLEKDRLIIQLQRALASQTQSQNAEAAGRYAQNQASFVQNQDLLASLGQQIKIHGLNTQQSSLSFGSGNSAFNQSPFLPGTTISPPGFPFNYGLSTTTQAPTVTTAATTTTLQPPHGAKGDGTTQVGSSLPTPSQPGASVPPSSPGFPVYGGFVPSFLGGTSFINLPSYGTSFLAPGTVTPVQAPGSSPTHFGIPILPDHAQKPTLGSSPSTPTTTPTAVPSPSHPSAPSSPPVNTLPLPVHPVHPAVTPLHPVASPVHPVTPLHPVLPATPSHVHPVQTLSTGTPTYGLQTPVINPVLYKPIKPVYPFYYYPNVAYHLQKPALPTYPWSYAPSYAQAKPTQIWK